MPQLSPSPWLMIFLLAWTALLFFYMNKTLNLYFPAHPTLSTTCAQNPPNWSWPWH